MRANAERRGTWRPASIVLMIVLLVGGLLAGCGSTSAVARAPVTIKVKLDRTSIPAGVAILGTVTLSNNTSKTIAIHSCPGDLVMIGLTNNEVPYNPAVATNACVGTVKLKPGEHHISVTVETFYTNCMVRPSSGRPICTLFGIPPLPTGHYWTKVITQGLPKGTTGPAPVMVTVTTPEPSVPISTPHGTVVVNAPYCSATRAGPPRVAVALWQGRNLLGVVDGDGRSPFVFRLAPGRYIVQRGDRKQAAVNVHVGDTKHVKLVAACT